ncbi:hypothetical protein ACWD4L_49360, partial [Streptomyces sp. NPDC002596]
TQWEMISTSYRCPRYDGDTDDTSSPLPDTTSTKIIPRRSVNVTTPVEGLWAHIKRSLANLAARTLSELETLLRRRLKALQYRHTILGGFLAGTGLALDRPN